MVLGKIFSVLSGPSILNNCIPPTFNRGKIVIAITTIPIPPSHCIMARHNKILFGLLSKSVIIVAPVVVIPDMLSKKASLKVNSLGDKRKGKLPKIATISQAKVENRKVCLKFNLNSLSKFAKTNNIPIKIVINDEETKL